MATRSLPHDGPAASPPDVLVPVLVAAVSLLAHLVTIGEYGIFRDEFYYLACGRRLAWGYVDHPPLVAVLARAGTTLFGDSPFGIRFLPVLCGVATVLLVGAIVRRLGGARFAQAVACTSAAIAPHYLFVFHILSMNATEILLWTVAGYLAIVAVQTSSRLAWLAFGVACGVGLLNKHSMLVFGAGITIGILATPARRAFATAWPWVAGATAAVIFLPHVIWQVQHGWPTLEFIRNAQARKIASMPPVTFLLQQALMMHPLATLVWLAGLIACFRPHARAEWRMLGWCYVVVLGAFLLQASKPYYVTPVYPLLLAAGGVTLERWLAARKVWQSLALAVLIAGGVLLAPLALPILPVDRFVVYQRTIGVAPAAQERHELGDLPQHYADMFGWEELAQTISSVYMHLPPEERSTTRVYARNYGQAGALEYYRERYPLPPVISAHNSYWYWGPGPDGGTVILIDGTRADWEQGFQHVEQAGVTRCEHCMPYENGRPVWVARGWKFTFSDVWPGEKSFI